MLAAIFVLAAGSSAVWAARQIDQARERAFARALGALLVERVERREVAVPAAETAAKKRAAYA